MCLQPNDIYSFLLFFSILPVMHILYFTNRSMTYIYIYIFFFFFFILTFNYFIRAINQIGVSQSPPLKSLTSSLGPTLWGSVSEPTRDYRADSDTICNDPRKSASHICAISQKDQSQLRLLVVVNKAQIYTVNTRCGTHHTPTHITQSIKLGYHKQC